MAVVEAIKELCHQRKTSIAALERACGFANGSIRKWDKSSTSYDRLQKVADYFGVSISDLTGDTENKKSPPPDDGDGLGDLQRRMIEKTADFTPEEFELLFSRMDKIKESRVTG